MGDSPGDKNMAEGLPFENILKIGLLNTNPSEERIQEFCKSFDIVAIKDDTMQILLDILVSIQTNELSSKWTYRKAVDYGSGDT